MANKMRGWVLLEVMLVVACFALVFAIYQRQQSHLNQTLSDVLHQHRQIQQIQMQQQIERLFAISVAVEPGHQSTPPVCHLCHSASLQALLRYELNQW